jgi:hypothetical protein
MICTCLSTSLIAGGIINGRSLEPTRIEPNEVHLVICIRGGRASWISRCPDRPIIWGTWNVPLMSRWAASIRGTHVQGETTLPLYRNVFRRQGSWSVTLRLAKSSIVAPLASMELSWRNCNKPAHACAEGRSAEMTIKKYRNFGDAVAGDSLSTLVRASLAIVLSHIIFSIPYLQWRKNNGKHVL